MNSLDQIRTDNTSTEGHKIVIHGAGGAGKSTFAVDLAAKRDGILLLSENGIQYNKQADGLAKLDIGCWDDYSNQGLALKTVLTDLYTTEHKFKTIIIDTLDALTPSLDSMVVGKNYGGDYKKADSYKQKYQDYVREVTYVLDMLKYLAKKGVDIVVVVHSCVQNFKDPQVETYQKWDVTMPGGTTTDTGRLLVEWADYVWFMTNDDKVIDGKGKTGGVVFKTTKNAAYTAKSRPTPGGQLPEKISLPLKKSGADIIPDYGEVYKYLWPDTKKVGKK